MIACIIIHGVFFKTCDLEHKTLNSQVLTVHRVLERLRRFCLVLSVAGFNYHFLFVVSR